MKKVKTLEDVKDAIKCMGFVNYVNENIKEYEEMLPKMNIFEKAKFLFEEHKFNDLWIDFDDVFFLEEAYAPHIDKTFISRVELAKDEDDMFIEKLVNYYYGEPDEDATRTFYLMKQKNEHEFVLRDSMDNKPYNIIRSKNVGWIELQRIICDAVETYGTDDMDEDYEGSDCIYEYVLWVLESMIGQVEIYDLGKGWEQLTSLVF